MAKKENKFQDNDITTQAIHTGTDYDAETGAVRRPLHMANSYKLPDDLSQVNYSSTDLLMYARNGNANQHWLEEKVAALYGADDAIVLASGVAALHALYWTLLKSGDQFADYDYVVDAVDTVSAKLALVMKCQETGTPIISSMGAGNKLDATAFRVADIYKTKVDPLARVMRRELKKRGVKKLKVVYSEEQPIRPIEDMAISCRAHCICPPGTKRHCTDRRDIPGSTAFVPSVAGLIIAGEVIKDLTKRTT